MGTGNNISGNPTNQEISHGLTDFWETSRNVVRSAKRCEAEPETLEEPVRPRANYPTPRREEMLMKSVTAKLAIAFAILSLAIPAVAQIYRYYSPGTIWTVTTIRIQSGMDPAYLQYLDGEFKKEADAQVNAGYMKSYKILRTLDDDESSWNLLILREYKSLAEQEADAEKSDKLSSDVLHQDDQKQMQGYEERSKVREVLATRTARELILK